MNSAATGDFPLDNQWKANDYYVSTSASGRTSSSYWHGERLEEDIFKQISSLLGLKIINVSIKEGHIELFCRRNRSLFKVRITGDEIIVEKKDGKKITEIILSRRYYKEYPQVNDLYDTWTTTTNVVGTKDWEYTASNAIR